VHLTPRLKRNKIKPTKTNSQQEAQPKLQLQTQTTPIIFLQRLTIVLLQLQPKTKAEHWTEMKQKRNISQRKHHYWTRPFLSKRRQLNSLHLDLSKLQPTKESSSWRPPEASGISKRSTFAIRLHSRWRKLKRKASIKFWRKKYISNCNKPANTINHHQKMGVNNKPLPRVHHRVRLFHLFGKCQIVSEILSLSST
jgi:hypothetical protein